MHPMLNIAIRAARAAGDSIVREMDRACDIPIEDKGKNDFVTEVDKNAEEIIISTIQKSYPDHAFLAEESGQRGESDYLWVIDPLDGTTNFLHSFPHFAVSIALKQKGILNQAVVYDPLKQELFTATKGKGAQLNNRKIRVSSKKELDGALLGTGFPYSDEKAMLKFIESYKALFPKVAGIRRAGVASLDLAYVASGRLDGFWEFNLKPWDIAAGVLLIQEAGGISAELSGGLDYLESGNIISANPKLLKAMLKIVS
ncbi:MAG: inositol monophosphatase [Legionellales bacterium]|nr:inositol monophosphatase [Legionellales bacterium]|tara:strand:- start:501 stop:1271 length:771 start_codon:yes stop_codon:yes gene_type:complete